MTTPISKKFLHSYLATALWSSTDDDGEPLEDSFSVSDFSEKALAEAVEDCDSFMLENADDLAEAGNDEQNGHDFWLTREGHGTGFWDRGYGAVGKRLTDAAHAYGEADIYIGDDGELHFG